MSARSLRTRLNRLGAPPASEEKWCAYHGPACEMGAQPLSELYRMVIEAKQRQGQEVPPLDEHREMTPEERRQYKAGYGEALAAAKARNEGILAELEAEAEAQAVVEEAARRVQGGP